MKENDNALIIVLVILLALFLFGSGMMGFGGMGNMMYGSYGFGMGFKYRYRKFGDSLEAEYQKLREIEVVAKSIDQKIRSRINPKGKVQIGYLSVEQACAMYLNHILEKID